MINELKIFSGRSNPLLASKIASSAGCSLGKISIKTFSDGEIWVKYEENVRGCDVFLVQSTNGPAENILELALMADAAVRASAESVSIIMPYFGYARQDRKDQPRVPISSRVMIDIITSMGADRIVTMDLHSTQIQGFTKIPFDHLYSRMVLIDAIKSLGLNDIQKFNFKNKIIENCINIHQDLLTSLSVRFNICFTLVINILKSSTCSGIT